MTEYGYNEVNELVLVRYPGRTEELFYDKAGNRTGRVADGVETRYEYDACNRLIRMTGRGQKAGSAGPSEFTAYTKDAVTVEFEYDNQGNLLRDDKAEYAVDVRNRVVKAELFDGNIQINRYDAEGLRAEVEENGRLTGFVFDGAEAAMEETEGETVRYIRGYRNRIIASDCESARQYYHYACDELGSVTYVVAGCGDSECGQQPDQRIRNTYAYDAFGNRTQCEEKIPNRFGYAGEQYDAVTQQYYLRARFYNPVIGRFTQEDSYHGDGLNLYAYCHNNPMYYVDPSGHDVRAAAEKDFVNKAVEAQLNAADKGVDAILEHIYGGKESKVNDPNIIALNELISELNASDGAKSINDINILKGWADEYGVGDKFNFVKTPYGYALQSLSDNAINMRDYVSDGGTLYRGGTSGRSKTIDAQFWATESPLGANYADKYGVDFSSMDFVINGTLKDGENFITRPAPALNGNKGGGIEVVTPEGAVKLNVFNTLD